MEQRVIEIQPFLDDDDIEDVLIIHLANKKDSVPRQVKKFDFNSFSQEYCFLNFRFYPTDLIKLKECLGVPSVIICSNRLKVTGLEALCIMLRRMAYTNRYY